MVKFGLQFQAKFDHVLKISSKDEKLVWAFKLKCTKCTMVTANWQEFSLQETISPLATDGPKNCHLQVKCRNEDCQQDFQITILPNYFRVYLLRDSKTFKTIAAFDVIGAEPVECRWSAGWTIKSAGNQVFNNVDMWDNQNDWAGFDIELAMNVGIKDMQYQFVKLE